MGSSRIVVAQIRLWSAAFLLGTIGGTGAPALAAPYLVTGLDQQQVWSAAGERVLSATNDDTVAVIDLARPDTPRILAALPLENSVGGPPVNIAVSPDDRLAIVADSYSVRTTPEGLDLVPANRLFIIDLASRQPRLVQTLEVGSQPSGISINPSGTLALVAYRHEHAVGVFRIERGRLRETGRIPLGDDISHVAFTPDGRRALAVHHDTAKLSLLDIDGDRVTASGVRIPVGPAAYVVEVTPDGRLALTINRETVSVIDMRSAVPRVIATVPVAPGGEGLAISPQGNLAAAVSLRGSNGATNAPGFNHTGVVTILRIDGTDVRVLKTIEVGRVPEAAAFTPDGQYLYVGNFYDRNFTILRVVGDDVIDTGKRLSLPGRPASARITPALPGRAARR